MYLSVSTGLANHFYQMGTFAMKMTLFQVG